VIGNIVHDTKRKAPLERGFSFGIVDNVPDHADLSL